MFDTLAPSPQEPNRPMSYVGPERRGATGPLGACLTRMLDEIDYGMLLVAGDGHVLYMNHTASLELDSDHPLQLVGRSLRAHRPQDVAPLYDALASAQRGLRRLLTLGEGLNRSSVSVVPLPAGQGQRLDDHAPATLLVLGKREVCASLSVQGYARSMNLTPAETRVLERLCAGIRPNTIAVEQAVAVSTIRTQIGSIRAKTGANSIAELVRQVAVLPPVVGALRAAVGVRGH